MLRLMSEIALGRAMSDDEFDVAKEKAVRKQKRIFESTSRPEVKDVSYLAQLVKEAVVENELMIATLWRALNG